jgi:hypothetical protein
MAGKAVNNIQRHKESAPDPHYPHLETLDIHNPFKTQGLGLTPVWVTRNFAAARCVLCTVLCRIAVWIAAASSCHDQAAKHRVRGMCLERLGHVAPNTMPTVVASCVSHTGGLRWIAATPCQRGGK